MSAGALSLGVCYYPEQWDEALWAEDAARMAALGLGWVRLGEFAWSRIEPEPGRFDWDWLDRAIGLLGEAGLRVIMSTPTAAPPKWLVDLAPEILPVGADGQRRKFGARRHYCFSSPRYRAEAARIAEAVARRYGAHRHVHAWQIDNEYGDHDTVLSYSPAAEAAFRQWLGDRYGEIGALNRAWGTSFWSMHYDAFDQIELPNRVVDDPAPAHLADFLHFSSDQVLSFHEAQAAIVRAHAPGRPVTHNFMNGNTDFDHHGIAEAIDLASWDSYPLGNLVHGRLPEAAQARYMRTGDPDQIAFNHDLYRGVGGGRFWVMEQQPGPVNWAASNPAPADGMVRFWSWLAFAHGAEMVSYFRWRQAPFAQEQFHTGLLLADGTPDQAAGEVARVAREIAAMPPLGSRARAPVAFVLDYPSRWALAALPQGRAGVPAHVALDWYAALRRQGVDIDIIGQGAALDGYRLVVAPDLVIAEADFVSRLAASGARAVFGPRSGSKTVALQVPEGLPPGPLRRLIDLRVTRVESLPDWSEERFSFDGASHVARGWRETIEIGEGTEVLARFEGAYRPGSAAIVGTGRWRYVATWPVPEALDAVLGAALDWAGVERLPLAPDLRLARRGAVTFAFNFGPDTLMAPAPAGARFLLGRAEIGPADFAAWTG